MDTEEKKIQFRQFVFTDTRETFENNSEYKQIK